MEEIPRNIGETENFLPFKLRAICIRKYFFKYEKVEMPLLS